MTIPLCVDAEKVLWLPHHWDLDSQVESSHTVNLIPVSESLQDAVLYAGSKPMSSQLLAFQVSNVLICPRTHSQQESHTCPAHCNPEEDIN